MNADALQTTDWADDDERAAFIAGFICAGGEAAEAKEYAESFMGCMRHHRAEEAAA